MRRYSNLQALPGSFFARDVYRDAAGHWKGVGLLYVLLLAALLAVAIGVRLHLTASKALGRQAPPLIAQMPTITVDHGRVGIDAPSPVVIRNPDGTVVAIIDTTASVTALEGSTALLLLTRDHLVMRKSPSETRMFDLARVEHFVITREATSRWVRVAGTWFAALISPFILAGIYVGRVVQQLLTALAAVLVGRTRGVSLDFAACMRLAALAITPATLVLDTLGFFGARIPGSGWLWCLFTLGYVVFAVNTCRPEPAAPAIPDAPTPG